MQLLWLYAKAVFSSWVATVGILLTITAFIPERAQKWVEARIMKDRFSLKHLWVTGALLLLVAFYQAWVEEHRIVEQLENDKRAVASEKDFWKGQSFQKDASLRIRDEMLSGNFSVLADTQKSLTTLSEKVLDISKPEPLRILTSGEDLPYYGGSQPREAIFLAFPNKVVGAVNAEVTCDKRIKAARAHMFGHRAWTGYSLEVEGNKVFIRIGSPAWTPTQPLVVYMAFEKELFKECSIRPL